MSIEQKSWLNLGPDEEVLWYAHPSMLMYLPRLSTGFILILVGAIAPFIGQIPFKLVHPRARLMTFGLIVFGLLFIVFELLRRANTYYVLTTEKVIRWDGLISSFGMGRAENDPIIYSQIENKRSTRTLAEYVVTHASSLGSRLRLCSKHDIGDIDIHTADDTLGDLALDDVPDLAEVMSILDQGIRNAARGGGGFTQQQNRQQNQQQARQQNHHQQQQRQQQPQGNHGQPPHQQGGNQGGGGGGGSKYPDQN